MSENKWYGLSLDLDDSAMHDSRLAEGSPAHRDRDSSRRVVDEFVESHDIHRIGLGFPLERDSDDPLVWVENSVSLFGCVHGRVVEDRK